MANILFIFEGEKTELKYFEIIKNSMNFFSINKIHCFSYCADIHQLANKIEDDGNLILIELLKEKCLKNKDINNYNILNNNKLERYILFLI